MARNRQRSKQRQAERRARRLEQQGHVPPDLGGPAADPKIAAGAPPEEEGRSDSVIEDEPRLDDGDGTAPPATEEEEALQEIEDWEVEDEPADDGEPVGAGEAGYAVRGRRGRDEH